MGWWSETILGGDTPLDILSDFEAILRVQKLYPLGDLSDEKKAQVRQVIDAEIDCLVNYVRGEEDSPEIAAQVLAVLVMTVGGKMSDEQRELFLQAGLMDDWSYESRQREEQINIYLDTVKAYVPGTPSILPNGTLMEAMVKANNQYGPH